MQGIISFARARRAPIVAALLAAFAAAATAGCGGASHAAASTQPAAQDSAAVEARIERARQDAAADARRDQRIKDLDAQVKKLRRQKHKRAPAPAATAAAAPAPAPAASSPSYSACDANISVAGAGCSFANNVFWTYWTHGQPSSLSVYDPGSGQYYATSCRYLSQIECTTARGAAVRFPQAAIDVYSQSQADAYAASHNVG